MCVGPAISRGCRGATGSAVDEEALVGMLCASRQDEFDAHNVSDELVEALAQQEVRAGKDCPTMEDFAEPTLVATNDAEGLSGSRKLGFFFSQQIIIDSSVEFAGEAAFEFEVWFEVARILDADSAWLRRVGPSVAPSVLLARASAAILLVQALQKGHGAAANLLPRLVCKASDMSISLGGVIVQKSDIEREQRRLLMCTPTTPSVATWMSIFIARLNVVWGLRFESLTARANVAALHLMWRRLLVTKGLDSKSARNHATGAICLALVSVGALSTDVLQGDSPEGAQMRAGLRVILCSDLEHIKACAFNMARDLQFADVLSHVVKNVSDDNSLHG